ncbi:MAG TPA: CRTAC1 family protein [Candidatus Limnocylindrales bacterium]
MSRRRVWLGAGLAALVLAVIGIGAAVLTRASGGQPTVSLGAPRLVDETAAAGIDHTYGGDFDFATGGGVAVFDCNADGLPDLNLAGGANPATLYRNESEIGGALRFGVIHDPATDLVSVTGAYPIDVDGDGIVDIAVLRNGQNVLLRGLGGCRFERANERWRFDGGKESTMAFSATWEGSASLPTLAIGNYVDPASQDIAHRCQDNELVRPDATGGGYAAAIPLTPSWCALSMLFSDWDRSGRRDLRVSNDRHYYDDSLGEEQLWRVAPGEPPRLYTDADGWVQVQVEGMGIASHDVTGDGYPDVYLTSQAANRLQTLTAGPSQPTYRDIGLKRGVNATRPFTGGDPLPSTAWHPEFEDVNNDGFIDLFVSKGNVDAIPDYAQKDPSNLLLGQPDGTFVEGADRAGIVSFARGRGAALADFNLDGLLDLVEVFYNDPVKAWRNVGTGDANSPKAMGHWLGIRLTQAGPNTDAIGAWLETKVGALTLQDEVTVGGGHVSGQLGWIHVGIGPATEAQVRVRWPDGQVGPWLTVKADSFEVLDRARNQATTWQPPAGT